MTWTATKRVPTMELLLVTVMDLLMEVVTVVGLGRGLVQWAQRRVVWASWRTRNLSAHQICPEDTENTQPHRCLKQACECHSRSA